MSGSEVDATTGAEPTVLREEEQRLRLPDDAVVPPLASDGWSAAPGEAVLLEADYVDTEDLRLLRWGVTLRRREGGSDAGWHLKVPLAGDDAARDEVRLPLDAGAPDEVPAPLADIVRGFVRSALLVHVARIRSERRPVVLADADGPLVEVVDDRVEATRDGVVVAAFRVAEVEVLGEPDDRRRAAMDATVELLTGVGGTPQPAGKLATVLAPDGVGEPDVVVPPEPDAHSPARDAVGHVLAAQVRDLVLADLAARRRLPDAVHRLRVAARRLRSQLRAFGPVLDDAWARRLRDELAWAADGMGAARDTEVFRERLDAHAEQLSQEGRAGAVPHIAAWVDARLAAASEAALTTLRSDRYLALLDDLVEAARAPRLTDDADGGARRILTPLARRPVRALRKAVQRLDASSTAEDWHRARIRAKRARYAVDAIAPLMGSGTARRSAALERVTDVLGELQDAVVAQATLRELASDARMGGSAGFALGRLAAIEQEREGEARARFADVWRDARSDIRWKR